VFWGVHAPSRAGFGASPKPTWHAPEECVFSAKGAASIAAWAAPQGFCAGTASSSTTTMCLVDSEEDLESRFQRSFTIRLESWGDAPGWHETAPLAR
jgi:hypothetical protein